MKLLLLLALINPVQRVNLIVDCDNKLLAAIIVYEKHRETLHNPMGLSIREFADHNYHDLKHTLNSEYTKTRVGWCY